MKSLKIVGFVLIAAGLTYAIVGVVQKMNENMSFLDSFLVAGGLILTGGLLILLFGNKPNFDDEGNFKD